MITDHEIAEVERRAQAACVDHPARRAAVKRLISEFHGEKLWPFSRDGHCRMLKLIASAEGDAQRLLFPPPDKTAGQSQPAGAPHLWNQERTA